MGVWLAMTAVAAATLAPEAEPAPEPGFSLADFMVDEDDDADARYLPPDVAERYGDPKRPARLRIRGRKVKWRVPLG